MGYKYCSNCGRKIKASAQFCPYCGHTQGKNYIQHSNIQHIQHNNDFNYQNNQNFLHKIGNFFSSHIYHIPTADFSHTRLKTRKVVSIIYVILMLIIYIPAFFSLFGVLSSLGIIPTLLLLLIGIVELILVYFVIRCLFNVDWAHFWKTWSIKKVIVIAVVLICMGGFVHSMANDTGTSDEQIENFKKSASNNQWKIAVGRTSNGELKTESAGDTYSIHDGTITDSSNNDQANYHIDGDTITLSNLNNAVSGLNVPYNQLVDNSTDSQSTKATASNDMEVIDTAKKMFKQSSDNDVVVFKADSGQGISGKDLLIFIKA